MIKKKVLTSMLLIVWKAVNTSMNPQLRIMTLTNPLCKAMVADDPLSNNNNNYLNFKEEIAPNDYQQFLQVAPTIEQQEPNKIN